MDCGRCEKNWLFASILLASKDRFSPSLGKTNGPLLRTPRFVWWLHSTLNFELWNQAKRKCILTNIFLKKNKENVIPLRGNSNPIKWKYYRVQQGLPRLDFARGICTDFNSLSIIQQHAMIFYIPRAPYKHDLFKNLIANYNWSLFWGENYNWSLHKQV